MTETPDSIFQQALVTIDWPFDAPPPIIRCPITGRAIAPGQDADEDYDDDEFTDADPYEDTPTLLFLYVEDAGEFEYLRAEVQEAIDAKRKQLTEEDPENDNLSDFEILSEHLDELGDCPLVFNLVTSGMACGPVSFGVYIGLDLYRAFAQRSAD